MASNKDKPELFNAANFLRKMEDMENYAKLKFYEALPRERVNEILSKYYDLEKKHTGKNKYFPIREIGVCTDYVLDFFNDDSVTIQVNNLHCAGCETWDEWFEVVIPYDSTKDEEYVNKLIARLV